MREALTKVLFKIYLSFYSGLNQEISMAIDIQNATLEQVQGVYQNAYKVARALQEFNQGTNVPVGETGGHGRYTVAEMNSMIEALKTAVDAVDDGA